MQADSLPTELSNLKFFFFFLLIAYDYLDLLLRDPLVEVFKEMGILISILWKTVNTQTL